MRRISSAAPAKQRIGMDWVPESSRRARVIPLYALFRTLGRGGIQAMIARTCALARRMADRLAQAPDVRILNDVVLNQVLARFGRDRDGSRPQTTSRQETSLRACRPRARAGPAARSGRAGR